MLTTSTNQGNVRTLSSTLGKLVIVIGIALAMLILSSMALSQPWRVYAASLSLAAARPTASLRYVAVEGTDAGNDCSISATPCATIQRAVDVAEPDDGIRVAAGTYTGVQVRQGITQVVYISQSVTIRGGYTTTNWITSDPETYATILDAQGQGRAVTIVDVRVILEGLRMTGGDTWSFPDLSSGIAARVGGGLYIASSEATISGCQIYSNTATYFGGGLDARSSAITVTQNRIFSNSLNQEYSIGGGLHSGFGPSVVDNNVVFNNSAVYGGGISLDFWLLGGRLSGNQIYNNQAFQRGGGLLLISMQTPDVLINRNVFSQNVAGADGGGAFLGTGISVVTGNLFVSNTASGVGGGAYVYYGSDTLMRNTFLSNTSSVGGGGVSIISGSATLVENYFEHNYAWVGGAVQVWDFRIVTITSNVLVNNTAFTGGGVAFDDNDEEGQIILTGNVLAENTATGIDRGSGVAIYRIQSAILNNNAFLNHPGYALMMDDGHVTATHNTIISNTGGIQLADFDSSLELTLIDTILARNDTALNAAAGTTATLDGVLWFENVVNTYGSGYITVGQQITADPLLAADGYHLLSGSPAIDAGVPSGITDDIDGEQRPSGPTVDIGADEWQYPTTVDLSITQQVVPSIVYPTEKVTYTIAYRNAVGLATGVIISAEIPSGLTNLSVVSSGAVLTSVPGVTYTLQVADLSSSAGGLITITAMVMPGLAPQVLTSAVSITTSQSDSNLANNTANAMLTVANRAPLANAGSDQSALVSAAITLDGSASTDADGHLPLTYEWQQVGGTPIMLNSNTVSRPTFIAPSAPSILRFSLSVTDSVGLQSTVSAIAVVTVTDRPVTNLAAANDSPTALGHATMFVAWAEGSNIVYTWNFGDGATAINQTVDHTYGLSGTYTAIVTASNGSGSVTAVTPVTITNLAPVAMAGSDQDVIVSSPVDLDGSGSYDQDGHMPLAYQWTQAGGPAVLLNSTVVSRPTFTAPATPGVLTFTLRVTDAYGLAGAIDTTVVHVNDQAITGLQADNSSPIRVGHSVNFTATLITGSNVIYQWNFGDSVISAPSNLLAATHVYTRYGSFTAIVTATNQSGINAAQTLVVVQPYSIYIPLLRKDS